MSPPTPHLNGWLKWAIVLATIVAAFVVVREGVTTNAERIRALQVEKANREVVEVQFQAILEQLRAIREDINGLRVAR